MKKIVYASALKLVAVILLVASLVAGVLVATNGMMDYMREDPQIYA